MSELTTLSAGELGRRLAAATVSAVDVTRAHLREIETHNDALGAFVRVNPEAETEARRADAMRRDGRTTALTGIPVAVKDNLATRELATQCGSRILEGFTPLSDATVVARLRAAGAVVLGKTNLDEFGMGSSTENSCDGPTRNPWDAGRVAGGSSGGSAAAVAAGLATVALGSDTGGSIRQPAAFCGIVGLKPTYGRVSRSGLVAFGSSLDQVGPLARTVADAATVLRCIAGADPRDSTAARRDVEDYASALAEPPAGLRVGLPQEYLRAGLDPDVERAVHDAAGALREAGADIVEVSLPNTRFAIPTYYIVATAEASSNLARFDAVRFGRRAAGAETLTAMYRRSRGQGFGPEVRRRIMLGTYVLSAGYYDEFYGKAQRVRTLVRSDFARAFDSGVDVLLAPPTPTTAFRLGEKLTDPLEMYLSDAFTVTANLAGVPALVVPTGVGSAGLPVSVQLIAPWFREGTLLRAGAAIEKPKAPVRRSAA